MPVMNMFPGGSTLQIPLDAPTSFSATAGNAQVELTWTDPLDKYATPEGEVSETGDQLVSEWDHTVLVRKTGSQPAGPNDGTVVVSSSVRNQYQSTAYVDSGLTNDTTYYYGVFAYNSDGVYSEGAFVSAMPVAGTPLSELAEGTIIKINENGAPVEFYLAKHNYEPDLNGQGRELVVRKDCLDNVSGNLFNITSYLSGPYLETFSLFVQQLIGTTKYEIWLPPNTSGITETTSAVFFPSYEEYGLNNVPSANTICSRDGTNLPIYGSLLPIYLNGEVMIHTYKTTRSYSPDTPGYNEYNNYLIGYMFNGADYHHGFGGRLVQPCFTLPGDTLIDTELNLVDN